MIHFKIQIISFAASPFRWKLPHDVIMIRFDEPIEQMDEAVTRQTLTLIESRLRTNNNEKKYLITWLGSNAVKEFTVSIWRDPMGPNDLLLFAMKLVSALVHIRLSVMFEDNQLIDGELPGRDGMRMSLRFGWNEVRTILQIIIITGSFLYDPEWTVIITIGYKYSKSEINSRRNSFHLFHEIDSRPNWSSP